MNVGLREEHQWLERIVGEWALEGETHGGTQTYRSLGGVWFIGEGIKTLPDGGMSHTLVTLGYDPARGKYVSAWVGSEHTALWVHKGHLNAERTALTMEAEGPSLSGEGGTQKYRDVLAFHDDDHRTVTSYAQDADGNWQHLATMHYRRKR